MEDRFEWPKPAVQGHNASLLAPTVSLMLQKGGVPTPEGTSLMLRSTRSFPNHQGRKRHTWFDSDTASDYLVYNGKIGYTVCLPSFFSILKLLQMWNGWLTCPTRQRKAAATNGKS